MDMKGYRKQSKMESEEIPESSQLSSTTTTKGMPGEDVTHDRLDSSR
jgi:hypothetical protein